MVVVTKDYMQVCIPDYSIVYVKCGNMDMQ